MYRTTSPVFLSRNSTLSMVCWCSSSDVYATSCRTCQWTDRSSGVPALAGRMRTAMSFRVFFSSPVKVAREMSLVGCPSFAICESGWHFWQVSFVLGSASCSMGGIGVG